MLRPRNEWHAINVVADRRQPPGDTFDDGLRRLKGGVIQWVLSQVICLIVDHVQF